MDTPRFQTIDATRFVAGQMAMFDGERFVPFVPETITGEVPIAALAVGESIEIVVDHSDERIFAVVLGLRVTATPGVRVLSMLTGASGASADNGRFLLLVENIAQQGYTQSFALNWERDGVV